MGLDARRSTLAHHRHDQVSWSLNRPANVDSSTKTLSGALMTSVADSADGFSLDSRLADFLPEYNVPGFRDITIRQAFRFCECIPVCIVPKGIARIQHNKSRQSAANRMGGLPSLAAISRRY